jgi:predicted PurR-regulated permease PerM
MTTKPSTFLEKSPWVAVFFFICFGWVTYETVRLAEPFLPGFLGAVILGLIFDPLYNWMLRRIRNPNIAASILTVGIFLITMVPVIWIGQMAVTETENLRPALSAFIENYKLPSSVETFLKPIFGFFDGFHIELKPLLLDKMEKMGARMNTLGVEMAKNVLITIFNGIILMSTLFFVFRDGRKLSALILSAVPIDPVNKQAIAGNVYQTFRAVVSGLFATAFIGGLADMIGFILAGVPLPVFFGLAATFFFLFGASALITVPAALWVMDHDTGWGIFLLIWGLLVSALGDNVLKPILMGPKAHMPFLLMLFSILGGIKLYGFMGLFLGPMVVTAFLSFWSIYRKDYKT